MDPNPTPDEEEAQRTYLIIVGVCSVCVCICVCWVCYFIFHKINQGKEFSRAGHVGGPPGAHVPKSAIVSNQGLTQSNIANSNIAGQSNVGVHNSSNNPSGAAMMFNHNVAPSNNPPLFRTEKSKSAKSTKSKNHPDFGQKL